MNDIYEEDDAQRSKISAETPANWPGATIMIVFFITVIVICGFCSWISVELIRSN